MPRQTPFEITFTSAIRLAVFGLRHKDPCVGKVALEAASRGLHRAPDLASNNEDRERANRFRDAFVAVHGAGA